MNITITEKIIIIIFSILCAVTIPDSEVPSNYVDVEQELAFKLTEQQVDEELMKRISNDRIIENKLNGLQYLIEVSYSVYSLNPPYIENSSMSQYIRNMVNEFNSLTSDNKIYFDGDIPDISITRMSYSVSF